MNYKVVMNTPSNATAKAVTPPSNLSDHLQQVRSAMLSRVFRPRPFLRNRHVMTLAGHLLSRVFPPAAVEQVSQPRIFQVEEGAQMLTHCGWQAEKSAAPTAIVVQK